MSKVKVTLTFLVLLFCVSSVRAEYSNETYKVVEMTKGASMEILNQAILYDATDCLNYLYVIYWHLYELVTKFTTENWYAAENLGLAIHKAPVVYFECYQLFNDTTAMLELMDKLASPTLLFHILENTGFNFVEILTIFENILFHYE